MKCEKITNKLGAYLDDELDEQIRRQVEEHLRQCPACTAELQELRHLSRYLDMVPEPEMRESFADDICEKASEQRRLTGKIVPFALLRDLTRLPNAAAAMAAIALGVLLGALMSHSVTTVDAARQASYSLATEQTRQESDMEYHIQALSATPQSSLEQAYLAALGTTEQGNQSAAGSE